MSKQREAFVDLAKNAKSVAYTVKLLAERMSVSAIAEHVGVSRQMVYKWMDGAIPEKDKLDELFKLERVIREEKYDVVLSVLQTHHDKLWEMTFRNDDLDWGGMDFIRLEQMDQLKVAIQLWKQHIKNREQE